MPDVTYLPELREQLRSAAAASLAEPISSRRRARRRVAAAVLAAGAVASAALVVAGTGGSPKAAANDVRSGGTLLRTRFAIFGLQSDAESPQNPFAPTASPRLLDPLAADGELDVNGDSVHRVGGAASELWVAATEQKVCLAVRLDVAPIRVACARPPQILDDGLFVWGRPGPGTDGGADVAGLIPDGVNAVTFELSSGARVDSVVSNNTVAAELAAPPVRAVFRDVDDIAHSAAL